MIEGLTLPFVTEPDPDTMSEGSLDPLGLFGTANQLADLLAPEVTARMSRVRFLTAICVGSAVVGEPEHWTAADGTPAYLPFEWLVVESFVRAGPPGRLDRVPGISKARARLSDRRRHLDGPSYLKTPKVFGFFGVYKRLARDLQLVDDDLVLLPQGRELLLVWEREQHLDGFTDARGGTAGGRLARRLRDEVRSALSHGGVRLGPTSRRWREIAYPLAPSGAGPAEAEALWGLLRSGDLERTRYIEAVTALPVGIDTEREALETIARDSQYPDLCKRIEAVLAFEGLVRHLDDAFTFVRVVASERSPRAVALPGIAASPTIDKAARGAPLAYAKASAALEPFGLAATLENQLGAFAEPHSAADFVDNLLARHEQVQAAKDARSWFEREQDELRVRRLGRIDGGFTPRHELLHPYRVRAVRSFAVDLGKAAQA